MQRVSLKGETQLGTLQFDHNLPLFLIVWKLNDCIPVGYRKGPFDVCREFPTVFNS